MIFLRVIFVCVLIVPFVARGATFVASQNLSFGTLVPVTTSGTVTIGLNGAITTNGSVTVAPSGTAYYAGLAVFTGSGLGTVADVVNVTVLNSSVTLQNGDGGTVTVNNFTTTPNLQISALNPSANVSVGGQMTFDAMSRPGNYTGNVQIRANSLLGGTATVTLPIRLTLWRALSVVQTQALNFGGIEMSGGNSVVAIAAASGARTVVSGANGVRLVTGRPGNSGRFTVTGNPNTAVTVTLPSSITLSGPGSPMTVNNFSSSPTTPVLDSEGKMTLRVGARLTVGASQVPGTYNGTYNLTVSY